jgi:hypothetical protein
MGLFTKQNSHHISPPRPEFEPEKLLDAQKQKHGNLV